MKSNLIVMTAIIALLVISIVAMLLGFNGQLRTGICVIIAGLAGWRIPNGK